MPKKALFQAHSIIHNQLLVILMPNFPLGVPKPIPLTTEFNKSVAADADILASDLVIQLDGILRVVMSLDTAAVFKMKTTRNATEKIISYNAGVSLIPDAGYLFDSEVRKGDKVNFRVGSAAVVHILNATLIVVMAP
ncbi:unnamed protein product [marine sediment metagenome]|uniref:Uncharacterized protein n=1 Tax=marine sediment metagenome TaxID=412755 RepID=X1TFE5_9ZZZZ